MTFLRLVAIVFVFPACSITSQYAHDLPVAYRSVTYGADMVETVHAARSALVEMGYKVACADSIGGIVFTEPRILPPKSSELGGTGRMQWFLSIHAMDGQSLMTAELILEAPEVNSWWPAKMNQGNAMSAYRALFSRIQDKLAVDGEDPGPAAPSAGLAN